jgi:homoserine O-succinyltransferase
MPKKIQTETQFARLIGATPLQVELSLIRMSEPRDQEHRRRAHGGVLSPLRGGRGDGREIRRADHHRRADRASPFEDVTYWDELTRVFDWTQTNVHSTFGVCWGGMAMIHHFHGVKKHLLGTSSSAATGT